jgi:hypothetical protein
MSRNKPGVFFLSWFSLEGAVSGQIERQEHTTLELVKVFKVQVETRAA